MTTSGYFEIEHTADWALTVWAPTLPALFQTAAQGMYALSGAEYADAPEEIVEIHIRGWDYEDLLVGFLNELLYLDAERGLGARQVEIAALSVAELRARVLAQPVLSRVKEIKAVTFHNVAIQAGADRYEVTLVFDV